MKKLIFSALALVSLSAYAQTGNVGINTTKPTNTLDVNGDVRVRKVEENTDPKNHYVATFDSQGVIQKIKNYRIVGSETVVATKPININLVNGAVQSTADNALGLSVSVRVPIGKKYGVAVFYSVPMGAIGIKDQAFRVNSKIQYQTGGNTWGPETSKNIVYPPQVSGYWGVKFLKNNEEVDSASRKITIPMRTSQTGFPISTVGANYFEVLDNTNGTEEVTNTYSLNWLYEQIPYYDKYDASLIGFSNQARNANIRFNMYDAKDNYYWGKGSISYILYELP